MAELAQCFRFYLANALTGDVELLSDLLEGVVGIHLDAEAHAQHFCFPRPPAPALKDYLAEHTTPEIGAVILGLYMNGPNTAAHLTYFDGPAALDSVTAETFESILATRGVRFLSTPEGGITEIDADGGFAVALEPLSPPEPRAGAIPGTLFSIYPVAPGVPQASFLRPGTDHQTVLVDQKDIAIGVKISVDTRRAVTHDPVQDRAGAARLNKVGGLPLADIKALPVDDCIGAVGDVEDVGTGLIEGRCAVDDGWILGICEHRRSHDS